MYYQLEKEPKKAFLQRGIAKLFEKRREGELRQKELTTKESPNDRNYVVYANTSS